MNKVKANIKYVKYNQNKDLNNSKGNKIITRNKSIQWGTNISNWKKKWKIPEDKTKDQGIKIYSKKIKGSNSYKMN